MNSTTADVIGAIALALAVASVLTWVARRCGQPAVTGQILTGIVLGPSLLGHLPGHLVSHLFPHQVLPYLTEIAQVAVVIFMFGVGYEIEFKALGRYGRMVPLIAVGSFFVPMGLGVTCALLLRPEFSAIGQTDQGRSFILFMGVAMSITALPVLAAIAREKNLAGTTVGVIATAAAGMMDVVAWLVLAATLIGTGHAGRFSLPVTLLLITGFIVAMLAVVQPAVRWWADRRRPVVSSLVPVAFVLAMASAWVTATLGLQPVFGAFLAGLTMRGRNQQPDLNVVRSMDLAGSLLLPLFFVLSGISLNVSSVSGDAFILLAVVVVVACAGKGGPAYGIARAGGLKARDAGTVAVLVNTRGLTELIALNVGLDDGIIGPRLFAVLVIMALVTTFATVPLLSLIRRPGALRPAPAEVAVAPPDD